MASRVSLLLITKNNTDIIEKTIESIRKFDDIVIVDSASTDATRDIMKLMLKNHRSVKILNKPFNDIGKQRRYGLKYCKSRWVLVLDSDELAGEKLFKEIKSKINSKRNRYSAFYVPYQNYFLGRRVDYGGENYSMIRLFKKNILEIKPSLVHNRFVVKKGKVGHLKNKIHHFSYRSLQQAYQKFGDYSKKMAVIKFKNKERSSFKKIFLYPVHMFWARFVEDKGYKDGFFRIPLDLGFAYMEFLTYLLLAFKRR